MTRDLRERLLLLLLTCLAPTLCAPPAQAAGPSGAVAPGGPSAAARDCAQRHYMSGEDHFRKGHFQAAHDEFEAAYVCAPLPDLLFNLALAAEKLGQPAVAIGHLESYLRERPDAPDVAEVRARIEVLQLRMKEAPVKEAPAQPEAAPASAQPAQPPATPGGPPGKPGLSGAVTRQAQPSHPQRSRRLPPVPALGLVGGGTVLLIIGIGLGGGALSTARTVESADYFDPGLDQHGQALSAAAISFDVLGALALGAGAAWTGVWFFRDRKENRGRAQVKAGSWSRGLALSGRF